MDNFTSCEEYYEDLRTSFREQNFSLKNRYYLNNDTEIWKSLDVVGYGKILAYAVIMIGGLLGNLSVILTVASVKTVRNAINLYLANLAITDAIICIVCMFPRALFEYTGGRFIWGAFMCKFHPFTQTTCLTASVLTLCAISCDRFLAVFRPLQVRTTEKRTSVIIVVIWILSIVVSTPFLFVKKHVIQEWADFAESYCSEAWPVLYYFDVTTNRCEKSHLIQRIYHVMLSVVFYFLPILIMFGAYSSISYKIWVSRIPGEHSDANIQAQARSKQKVLKMVIVVLIVFVVCWTPLQVILFLMVFGLHRDDAKYMPIWLVEFEWFSYYIAFANSFMNPFIYGHYNKDFRNGLYMIICCGRKKRGVKRIWSDNIFTKSIRSMSTTLSTLRTSTQAFMSKRMSKNIDIELPETAV